MTNPVTVFVVTLLLTIGINYVLWQLEYPSLVWAFGTP